MKSINNLPTARPESVQLQPVNDPAAVSVNSVSTSTATSITLTGTSLVKIISDDYGVYLRRKTATDTTACTASNFHDYVPAGSIAYHPLKDGATGLSLLAKTSTASIIVIEW